MGVVDVSEAHDRELVDRLRQGDEDAFRGLFGRYAPSAKALALRVVRQSHLAEEIVQEAFLAVWRAPEGYDDERGSVRSWLMGMVHHRAVDMVLKGLVIATDGTPIDLAIDSLCIHGDAPNGVDVARTTAATLEAAGIAISTIGRRSRTGRIGVTQ